jgi:hypothetical protein
MSYRWTKIPHLTVFLQECKAMEKTVSSFSQQGDLMSEEHGLAKADNDACEGG